MAKMSMINREIKRQKLVKQFTSKRLELKQIVKNRDLPMEERFKAQIKLAKLPMSIFLILPKMMLPTLFLHLIPQSMNGNI